MRLIYGEDERLLRWAQAGMGGLTFRDDATTIGIERNGEISAVAVFDGFSHCDCNIHVNSDGSKRWLTREFLAHVFAYPFIQCGFRRVTALVPASNSDALRFDLKLGFEIEGYCRHAMPDDDIIVLGMLRENCRYIPKEYRHGRR